MLTITRFKKDDFSPRGGFLRKPSLIKKMAGYPAPETRLVKRPAQSLHLTADENYNVKQDLIESITSKGGLPMLSAMGMCLMISSILFNSHSYWPADSFLVSAVALFIATIYFYKKS